MGGTTSYTASQVNSDQPKAVSSYSKSEFDASYRDIDDWYTDNCIPLHVSGCSTANQALTKLATTHKNWFKKLSAKINKAAKQEIKQKKDGNGYELIDARQEINNIYNNDKDLQESYSSSYINPVSDYHYKQPYQQQPYYYLDGSNNNNNNINYTLLLPIIMIGIILIGLICCIISGLISGFCYFFTKSPYINKSKYSQRNYNDEVLLYVNYIYNLYSNLR